ncbi:MAG: hypothetical protein KGO49_14120 [Gammaproteobacteria bacterium]|nr:hypothetical protein [Gammaproteobacteria bacterium]
MNDEVGLLKLNCYSLEDASTRLCKMFGQQVDSKYLVQLALDGKLSLVVTASFAGIIFMAIGDVEIPEHLNDFLESNSSRIYFKLSSTDLSSLIINNKFTPSFYSEFYYIKSSSNFYFNLISPKKREFSNEVATDLLEHFIGDKTELEYYTDESSFSYSRAILPPDRFIFAFSDVETGQIDEIETFLDAKLAIEIGINQVAILAPEFEKICRNLAINALSPFENKANSSVEIDCDAAPSKSTAIVNWPDFANRRAKELMQMDEALTLKDLGKIIHGELIDKGIKGLRGTKFIVAGTVERKLSGFNVTNRKPNGK